MRWIFKALIWLIGGILSLLTLVVVGYALRLSLTDWSEAARADIEAWHTLITAHHPGPVDPQNPGFAETLAHARLEALALADQVENGAGYRWALARYEALHSDPHLHGMAFGLPGVVLERRLARYDWPGFHAHLDQGADGAPVMVVSEAGGGFERGDVIASCDGQPIASWLAETAFAYRLARIPAERRAAAPWLFARHGNPFIRTPERCRILGGGDPRPLAWRSISAADWQAGAPDQRGERGAFDYTQTDAAAWIKLPSFSNNRGDTLQALSDRVSENSEAVRAAPIVVFDLRGNTGGNSAWGRRFAQIVWSEAYVEAFRRTSAEAVDWRVSPDNINHVIGIAERAAAEGRSSATSWSALARDMEAALADGEPLHRQTFAQRQPTRDVPAPLAGRVFVLIDAACGSACLDFLDLVHAFEDVTFVGAETSADTNYIDVRRVMLPGFRFGAIIPLKVYRGRVRPDGGSYQPDIPWPSDLDLTDDAAITAWLAGPMETPAP